jgi:hypothetical protein
LFVVLVTDSSIDSSSDERRQGSQESAAVVNAVTLQRKVSDRKSKRIRAKPNDATSSTLQCEVSKKSRQNKLVLTITSIDVFSVGSDDDILADDDKHVQQQQYQKKKRRPSFKRRKKIDYDQTQTDSGIDSRMGTTSC